MGILSRARGILGTGLTWAVAWAPVGVAVGIYSWLRLPTDPGASPLIFLPLPIAAFATFGAISGATFATVLAVAERRSSLDELSMRQTAAWGALGGLLFPAMLVAQTSTGSPVEAAVTIVGLGAALGASSAAGTLCLARRRPASLAPEVSPGARLGTPST